MASMTEQDIRDGQVASLPRASDYVPGQPLGPIIAVPPPPVAPSALDIQEGGSHYKDRAIQPVEYIHANGLGFFEGSVIKYVTRWRDKGGVSDLKKARHFLALLIELEEKQKAK